MNAKAVLYHPPGNQPANCNQGRTMRLGQQVVFVSDFKIHMKDFGSAFKIE